ncbi:MAG: hypothetical protein ACREOY_13730 [Candidatus Dormibacteraceae bacterium]
MDAPWTRSEASASGQVFEFRLWALLTEQSRGQLHVFLPLTDRGIDGLVHRLTDGTYFRVQAKARSSLVKGEVELAVWASALLDDDALLVAGLVVEGGLGPTMLVVPVREFKRLADLSSADGAPVYSTGFGMNPRSDSRWLPWLVPAESLVERFGIASAAPALAEGAAPRPTWRSDVGFLGEAEVVRLLAQDPGLNLFRPFPDLETSELGVLHLESRRVLGIQVKTVGVDAAHPSASVMVLASSFRPSPSTYIVVLGWLREEARFHEECLVIPSEELHDVAEPKVSHGHFELDWHPGSTAESHLNKYRRELDELRNLVSGLVSA